MRLDEALDQLLAARNDSLVRVAVSGAEIRRFRGEVWVVRPASPAPTGFHAFWPGLASWRLPELDGVIRFRRTKGAGLPVAAARPGRLEVRLRRGGERFRPDERRPRRTLKALLQESGVPPWERLRLPLLYCDGRLVWVPGLGLDAAMRARSGEAGLEPNMDVLPIPTHVPVSRLDATDIIDKTTAAKYSAIVKEVEEVHQTSRPILIGTRSIDHNQIVADFIARKKIPHQVLNAKNHEKEAFIIADAGKKGAITVATNIAGRGVDIVLGGSNPELKDFRSEKTKKYKMTEYESAVKKWQKAHDDVVKSGGLHIIGTERHESRRIDNQLRGRAGRQGDPGSTQFYISLEDDIMRIFGGEQIAKVMNFLKIEDDQPIEHGMISKID